MPLFQRRKAQEEKAAKAAAGESPGLVSLIDPRARTRLLYAISDAAPSHLSGLGSTPPGLILLTYVHQHLEREWGMIVFAGKQSKEQDLPAFVLGDASTEQILDVVEATIESLRLIAEQQRDFYYDVDGIEGFRKSVNRVFDEHDIAFVVVGNEVLPRDSMVMYADVVAPALVLLDGDRLLANVEMAFLQALRELKPGGSPSDAITDAARALQEMLVALQCRGNALGALLDDARKKGLLGPHDSNLTLGVEKIGDWVSADRSERGDAHLEKATDADDAWLAVHVVGALIVRLAKRM